MIANMFNNEVHSNSQTGTCNESGKLIAKCKKLSMNLQLLV